MIYSALGATITRSAGTRVLRSNLSGNKGKSSYTFSNGPLVAFTDDFNRLDNPSSLVSSATKSWRNSIGTWGIDGSQAATSTAVASYPLAYVYTGKSNATAKIGYAAPSTHGWGVSYWVTDATTWYATYLDRTYYQSSSQVGYYACPGGYLNCGNGYYQSVGGWGCGDYTNGTAGPSDSAGNCPGTCTGCPQGGNQYLTGYQAGVPGQPCFCECHNSDGYVSCGPLQYTTVYQDNYVYWLRTVKYSSGSAVLIDSQQYTSSTDPNLYTKYVEVQTDYPVSNSVTVKYSVDGVTPTTYTIAVTTPTKGKGYGILLAPTTTGTQAIKVDNFQYTPTP